MDIKIFVGTILLIIQGCPDRVMMSITMKPQIREQMSGPEISRYGKSLLSCGLWAVAWAGPRTKKGRTDGDSSYAM